MKKKESCVTEATQPPAAVMLSSFHIHACTSHPVAVLTEHEPPPAAGKLWNSLIGIIIMLLAWIILLMRLAATHDVLRVKHKLQTWLSTQGERTAHFCRCPIDS